MSLSIVSVIGFLTVVFAILVKLIGIPDQIWQTYRRKSTEGLSFLNQLIGFIAYVLWTLHGMFQHDAVLIYGQLLGVVMTGIVLAQFAVYRRK